jgi:hypothetical protein
MGIYNGFQLLFVPDYYWNSVAAIPIYIASRSTKKEPWFFIFRAKLGFSV